MTHINLILSLKVEFIILKTSFIPLIIAFGLSTQFCGHATPYMESLYSQLDLPIDPFLRVKLGSC